MSTAKQLLLPAVTGAAGVLEHQLVDVLDEPVDLASSHADHCPRPQGLCRGLLGSLRVGLVDMPFPPWPGDDVETPEQPQRAAPTCQILPAADGGDSVD